MLAWLFMLSLAISLLLFAFSCSISSLKLYKWSNIAKPLAHMSCVGSFGKSDLIKSIVSKTAENMINDRFCNRWNLFARSIIFRGLWSHQASMCRCFRLDWIGFFPGKFGLGCFTRRMFVLRATEQISETHPTRDHAVNEWRHFYSCYVRN